MTPYAVGLALLLAAACSMVLVRRSPLRERVFTGLVLAGAIIAAVPALRVLGGANGVGTRWASGVPGGDWAVGIDSLSAVFLLAVLGIGAASAVFGTWYLGGDTHLSPSRRAFAHAAFAMLVASLAVVVTAQSVLLFLCAWELMAIGSFVLILTDHEHAEARRAALTYIVATHTATLVLFALFALWAQGSRDWTFASLAAAHPDAARTTVILTLALVAFGVKAGLVPLHFWLPSAHSASPSHVSALMSGVVIKTGIYGILRVVILLGGAPAWWGWTVLLVGGMSAVLGVLWALAQHDVKRLLAYHSVENIGIILMGVGVGALGAAYGHASLAVLGYAAATLHVLNHALFKALLFLSAGVVGRVTGTRNLEELGGLARPLPLTWLAFLVGSAAIIGVPPFNGFVSEWLLFQGLLRSGGTADSLRLAILGVPALALVGGLALACFAKVAGVTFLGRARSARAVEAREPPPVVHVPTMALAMSCVVIGAAPVLVVRPFLRVAAAIAGAPGALSSADVLAAAMDARRISSFAAVLLLALGAVWLVRQIALRRQIVRSGAVWGCGFAPTTPRMQYTASSFAAPLVSLFGRLSGVHEHRGATVYHSTPRDLVLDGAVLPLWDRIQRAALRLRPMQQGRLHVYLLFIVATLLVLLAYLVAAPGSP